MSGVSAGAFIPGVSGVGNILTISANAFGFSPGNTAAQNDNALARAFASVPSGTWATVEIGPGVYNVSSSHVLKRNIKLVGSGQTTRLNFVPTSSNAIFITWTKVDANLIDMNEESQLPATGVSNLRLQSDRSIRANGFKFIGCDYVDIDNVFVFGLKGFSINLQRSREISINTFRTRYNGYLDHTNHANSVADVIMGSVDGTGDTTNYSKFNNLFLLYSFGDSLEIIDCPDMNFTNLMIHQIPKDNLLFETNIVRAFPIYNGQTAAAGFASGGIPRNEYAELYVSPGGEAPNISGLGWKESFLNVSGCYLKNTDFRLSGGELIGGLTNYNLWADTDTRADILNYHITSASAAQKNSSSLYTSTFTFASNVLTVSATCPSTGTPVQITNSGGSLPIGITRKNTYYIIKLSDTTCSLASTRQNAIAGTVLAISGGAGTHTITAVVGYNILATQNTTVNIGHTGTRLGNGYQAMFSDITADIRGTPTILSPNNYVNSPIATQLATNQVLFILRDADFTSASDQAFRRLFGGDRYVITSIFAKGIGGAASAATAGGIYTGAGKTGNIIVANTQSWIGVSTNNKIQIATLATYSTTDAARITPFLSLTTGSATACRADVYICGYPVD